MPHLLLDNITEFIDEVGRVSDGQRYDDDFYAWTQHQAAVLRDMAVTDNRFDREHIAEEIEDLGKSERDAVRSQIRRILEHFLKLAYSPADPPRFLWMASIVQARAALSDKVSPTLRRDAEASLRRLYEDARDSAILNLQNDGEFTAAERLLPTQCPYDLDEVMRRGWCPARDGAQP